MPSLFPGLNRSVQSSAGKQARFGAPMWWVVLAKRELRVLIARASKITVLAH